MITKTPFSVLSDDGRRNIPGIATRYTVDRHGNVYSGDKLLTGSIDGGYLRVRIKRSNGEPVSVLVHRLVVLAWVSGRDPERGRNVVDHIDGNKLNNDASNLRWVTIAENNWLALYEQKLYARRPHAVIATHLASEEERLYLSIAAAARDTGANEWHIYSIVFGYDCDCNRKSSNGWAFRLADPNEIDMALGIF